MNTLLLLALGLLLTTGTSAQRRPRPQAWRCPAGPAYLSKLARRPSQRHLDSLASAARRRALLTAK
jgi:hypothetical protein